MNRLVAAVILAAGVSFCLGPFLWQMLISLGAPELATQLETPRLSLSSYSAVLGSRSFSHALLNSSVVAACTTAISVLLGSAAAFALAHLPVPGKRAVLGALLVASMLPPIAAVSPLYLVVRTLGLQDQLAGLVLPYTGFALPLTIWVMTDYFERLPRELYRAACVDGCSPWQAFYKVYLPIAVPGLSTTALLAFVFSWNEFLFALTFTSSPEARTVPVAIALFAAEHREPWAETAAASVLSTLPLVLLAVAFQRRVIAGLTAGAMKG